MHMERKIIKSQKLIIENEFEAITKNAFDITIINKIQELYKATDFVGLANIYKTIMHCNRLEGFLYILLKLTVYSYSLRNTKEYSEEELRQITKAILLLAHDKKVLKHLQNHRRFEFDNFEVSLKCMNNKKVILFVNTKQKKHIMINASILNSADYKN